VFAKVIVSHAATASSIKDVSAPQPTDRVTRSGANNQTTDTGQNVHVRQDCVKTEPSSAKRIKTAGEEFARSLSDENECMLCLILGCFRE
jgi:hypothetical protein